MFVIGTAGHVDHGKSALVQALSGTNPDRLHEEKVRGMTIELGFAWFTLPSKRQVSIVDVPGHEKFIKNMLAGVGGIDLALLVIAADEAIMPQTIEHLAILDLLEITQAIVAITKTDLVDQDWLELVSEEVENLLKKTSLEGSPIYGVSTYNGNGIKELISGIDKMLNDYQPKKDVGRPRLPIDRSFLMSGFGTVVTGTLVDGSLKISDELELAAAGKRVRVRGLQTHRVPVESAQPGSRVAVNIVGVDHNEIQRGDILTIPDLVKPTVAIDVHLRILKGATRPLKHNTTISLHVGTSETQAKVRLLDQTFLSPGEEGLAQLKLAKPIALIKGDRFVIRSTKTTLGGGRIVEPYAKRHRRSDTSTLSHLTILQNGTAREILFQTLETLGPSNLKSLALRSNFSINETRSIALELIDDKMIILLTDGPLGNSTTLVSKPTWEKLKMDLESELKSYHYKYPLRPGAPTEEIRKRIGVGSIVCTAIINRLGDLGSLVIKGPSIHISGHQVVPTKEQRKLMENYAKSLKLNPYSPPTTEPLGGDLLNLLEEEGEIVRVNETMSFNSIAYKTMLDKTTEHLRKNGKVTISEIRDLFKTSRKYALAFMEHLDQIRVTRRVGDDRVLRKP